MAVNNKQCNNGNIFMVVVISISTARKPWDEVHAMEAFLSQSIKQLTK
jgi:hypothetical protein